MATIRTTTRLINVKETFNEVIEIMDFQQLKLTEDTSFFGEMSGKMHKGERDILLNRRHIVEVYE